MRSREICGACQRPSPLGFHVPEEVWEACVPRRFVTSPLCVLCFATFGDEAGVAWDRQIKFFPVSLVTHNALSERDAMGELAAVQERLAVVGVSDDGFPDVGSAMWGAQQALLWVSGVDLLPPSETCRSEVKAEG